MYVYLQQFADACVLEKEAIRVENPDHNKQYKQLYDCLKAFNKIPMRDGSKILHPSNSCSGESTDGHMLFLPTFVKDYMTNIPEANSKDIPYVDNDVRRDRPDEVDSISIFYANAILCPNGIESFTYRVSEGTQQIIVIAEDETILDVEITSKSGTSITTSTNSQAIVQQIWDEPSPSTVCIKVKNPTDKHVTFVIAVH